MTSIVVPVTLKNTADPSDEICFDAVMAQDVGWLTRPRAWRDRLGTLPTVLTEPLGEVCGPVTIQIEASARS